MMNVCLMSLHLPCSVLLGSKTADRDIRSDTHNKMALGDVEGAAEQTMQTAD